MRHWLGNALRGLCIGSADVVPGVSGGTIALILGIYPRLVDAVGSIGPRMLLRLREGSFRRLGLAGLTDPARLEGTPEGADAARMLLLASLAAGMVPAVLLGASVLPALLDARPAETMAFFLGLVMVSVRAPLREMHRRRARHVVLVIASCAATLWFTGLPEPSGGRARGTVTVELEAPPTSPVELTPGNLVLVAQGGGTGPDVAYGPSVAVTAPAGTTRVTVEVVARMASGAGNRPADALEVASAPVPMRVVGGGAMSGGRDPGTAYLFLGGMLAVSAMVLPGVSGAFVLLLLGLYHFVLHALASLVAWRDPDALAVVVTFVAAAGVGLLTFVRVLKWLLARRRDATLAVLAGLMLGSLRRLWPFTEFRPTGEEALVWPSPGDPGLLWAAAAFAAGVAVVLALEAAGRRIKAAGEAKHPTV